MSATEHVILVDENDTPIGTAEKLQAHLDNLCHRAFSVFIFRKKPSVQLLLQQRAQNKYHSPLLWTNTCCSHPRPDEDLIHSAERRLQEEMNIKTTLRCVGRFHYVAHFTNGLSENEIDYVLVGFYEKDEPFIPNSLEVADHRWITLTDLNQELKTHPERFTPWLSKALELALRAVPSVK